MTFAAHGFTKNADVMQELYRVFGTETARRIAGLYIENADQVKRVAHLYDNALGGKAYGGIVCDDYAANVKNIEDAFSSLMSAAGAPMVRDAISAMHGLTDIFNDMTKWTLAHPVRMRVAGDLAELSAGIMTLGGAVASVAGMVALSRLALVGAGWLGSSTAMTATTAVSAAAGASFPWALTIGRLGAFFAPLSMIWGEGYDTSRQKHFIESVKGGKFGPALPERFSPPVPVNANGWDAHLVFWYRERATVTSSLWRPDYKGNDLASEMDREAARGRALTSMPPPIANTNVKVENVITLAGKAIVASVQTRITKESCAVDSSTGFDGRASCASPDMP